MRNKDVRCGDEDVSLLCILFFASVAADGRNEKVERGEVVKIAKWGGGVTDMTNSSRRG